MTAHFSDTAQNDVLSDQKHTFQTKNRIYSVSSTLVRLCFCAPQEHVRRTIVRSKLHISRLSCVHFFPDRVILNARRHLVRSFRSGHIDFRSGTSTWGAIFLHSNVLYNKL